MAYSFLGLLFSKQRMGDEIKICKEKCVSLDQKVANLKSEKSQQASLLCHILLYKLDTLGMQVGTVFILGFFHFKK